MNKSRNVLSITENKSKDKYIKLIVKFVYMRKNRGFETISNLTIKYKLNFLLNRFRYVIINIDWWLWIPGMVGASRVWDEMEQKYDECDCDHWCLGDSGYPIGLMTPYRVAAAGSPEVTYNDIHSKARNCVERFKSWHWLIFMMDNKTRFSPEQLTKIVNVWAALHNM